MRKILTVLFALMMVLSLCACSSSTPETDTTATDDTQLADPAPTAANTYADFVDAEPDTELELLMSVQAHESWWDGKVTVYGQDDNGGYLCYDMACDEATAEALTPGTLIKVKGYKAEWDGEVELSDATCEIIAGGYDGKVYDPKDLTDLLGNFDELSKYKNVKGLFKNLTVVSYDEMTNDKDGYLTVNDADGNKVTFVVRRYLTNAESEVATTVASLKEGDVVDLTAFVYWYLSEPQARIIEVSKAK